ncbi:hypothetical protein [Metabacillus sp. FJAT-52054]|uniref:Uncharacterized protein n=1 Tax=Metabacillus sediminis TaxID=3117746 RepID=A0ABZ2NJJ4_9BACI
MSDRHTNLAVPAWNLAGGDRNLSVRNNLSDGARNLSNGAVYLSDRHTNLAVPARNLADQARNLSVRINLSDRHANLADWA